MGHTSQGDCDTHLVDTEDGLLTRDEVEKLLHAGVRWRIHWCQGANPPPASGRGEPLPSGALSRVPSPAALRKHRLGRSNKSLMLARLTREGGTEVLDLREMGS